MATINIKKSDSIQTIKSALMKTGNTIIFEKATYKVTETLYFNSNNIIKGNGATLQMAAPIHNILMSYTTPNSTKYNGVHDVQILDLNVEQMYSKYGACKCNGITLWHCNRITIDGGNILDTIYFHGIEENSSTNITIKNVKFSGYVSDLKNNFREASQIDFASEGSIFIHPSGSKCYDLTPCKNIMYINCEFGKSNSRTSPSFCIGTHSQPVGLKHEDITIKDCKFYGDKSNKNGCAIHLTAMNNVTIENCYSEDYARFVLIDNKTYSYDKKGNKVTAKDTDGLCENVVVRNNTIKPLDTFKVVDVFVASKTKWVHKNIINEGNTIIE